MDAFCVKGFFCIGAVKTNRVIYPKGIKQNITQFAQFLRKTDRNVSLVTVGKRKYYVYRYEGNLNDVENAIILISYPKDAFGKPHAILFQRRKSWTCIWNGGQSKYFFVSPSKNWLLINIRFELPVVFAGSGFSCPLRII